MKSQYTEDTILEIKKNSLLSDIQFKKMMILVTGMFNLLFFMNSLENNTVNVILHKEFIEFTQILIQLYLVFNIYHYFKLEQMYGKLKKLDSELNYLIEITNKYIDTIYHEVIVTNTALISITFGLMTKFATKFEHMDMTYGFTFFLFILVTIAITKQNSARSDIKKEIQDKHKTLLGFYY